MGWGDISPWYLVLGRAGAEVIVAARRADALAQTCTIMAEEGLQGHALTLDVTDEGSVTS